MLARVPGWGWGQLNVTNINVCKTVPSPSVLCETTLILANNSKATSRFLRRLFLITGQSEKGGPAWPEGDNRSGVCVLAALSVVTLKGNLTLFTQVPRGGCSQEITMKSPPCPRCPRNSPSRKASRTRGEARKGVRPAARPASPPANTPAGGTCPEDNQQVEKAHGEGWQSLRNIPDDRLQQSPGRIPTAQSWGAGAWSPSHPPSEEQGREGGPRPRDKLTAKPRQAPRVHPAASARALSSRPHFHGRRSRALPSEAPAPRQGALGPASPAVPSE